MWEGHHLQRAVFLHGSLIYALMSKGKAQLQHGAAPCPVRKVLRMVWSESLFSAPITKGHKALICILE